MKGPTIARWLVLAGLLAFLAIGDAPDRTRLWVEVFEFGHAPLFGVIAIVVHGLLSSGRPAAHRTSATAFAITVGLGAVTEILQIVQPGHDASFPDLARDAGGALSFLLFRAALRGGAAGGGERRGRFWLRTAAVSAGAALLLACAAELIDTGSLYIARARAFPTLYALDGSRRERMFVGLGRNSLTPAALALPVPGGLEHLARLDLRPGPYSGISFREPYPDWEGYRRLVFTVVSDLDAPLALSIRIHDAEHDQSFRDRFNRRLTVAPGINRFAIPLDDVRRAPAKRQMDLRRVRAVMLFGRVETPMHLYLGPLRLE